MKKRIFTAILAATLLAGKAFADDYDIVINNGCVMDPETNSDVVRYRR